VKLPDVRSSHKIGYPSKVLSIRSGHRVAAFQSIGEQQAHSPIGGEAERNLAVLLIEVADATRESRLIDCFTDLLLKEHGWAANLQPDHFGFRAGTHYPTMHVNHIVQRRSPVPGTQGSPQLAACGGQEETEGE